MEIYQKFRIKTYVYGNGFFVEVDEMFKDSSPVIMVFMKSGSLFVESSMSCEFCVYG